MRVCTLRYHGVSGMQTNNMHACMAESCMGQRLMHG